MRHSRRDGSGFTLIELMIVLAIVAIMATIAIATTANTLPSIRVNQGARDIMMATQMARSRAVRTGRPYKICIYGSTANNVSKQGGYQILGCNPTKACNDPTLDIPVCDNTTSGAGAGKLGTTTDWNVPSLVPTINGLGVPLSDVFRVFDSAATGFPFVLVSPNWLDSSLTTFTTATNVVEIEFTPYGLVDPNTTTVNAANGNKVLGGITITYAGDPQSRVLPTRTMIIDPAGGVRVQ